MGLNTSGAQNKGRKKKKAGCEKSRLLYYNRLIAFVFPLIFTS